MKKHLIAFLSMVGLAGAAVPVPAQVLKGSAQQSKTESQIKQNKRKHEANAVQKVREASLKRGITADVARKNATNAQLQSKDPEKSAKVHAAQKSVQSDLQKKIVKTKTGVKGESQNPN